MKDWVVLTTLPLITEAETLRARLQAHDIHCMLQSKRLSGDNFSRATTERNIPASETRVLVRAEDVERARAISERLAKSRRKTRV
ncbi:MAG TPA: DUF2007 domain-containing protein, partial [Abditibacteriaceae bacterium]|nr:DUF2007 domain-containing protein [Abditibacteriaceae bacterium]